MLLYDTKKLRYEGTLAVYTWYDYSEKFKIIKADKFTGSLVEVQGIKRSKKRRVQKMVVLCAVG